MLDEEMRYFLEYCRISDFSKKSIESLSIYNGGSGQASLLIFNGYRSKNRCFQALYHSFRPQNGHHKVQTALEKVEGVGPSYVFAFLEKG